MVQNKFQQTNKTKINHINDNHIKFEVSLLFRGIWPTVRQALRLVYMHAYLLKRASTNRGVISALKCLKTIR